MEAKIEAKRPSEGFVELQRRLSSIEAAVEELVWVNRLEARLKSKNRAFVTRYAGSVVAAGVLGAATACFNIGLGFATFFLALLICGHATNLLGLDAEIERLKLERNRRVEYLEGIPGGGA